MKKCFIVKEAIRITSWFREHLPNISYNLLQIGLRRKDINVNGNRITTEYQLKIGDQINIWDKICLKKDLITKEIQFISKKQYVKIVDQNENYVVIDKRAGVSSQKGTNVFLALVDILKSQMQTKPYIVHRLDKDVSGLMIIALNAASARSLSVSLQLHQWTKKYIAILNMNYKEYNHLIANIFIDDEYIKDSIDNRDAITKYKLLGYTSQHNEWPLQSRDIKTTTSDIDDRCVFELEPITGRKPHNSQ